jgi:hypothetical protein
MRRMPPALTSVTLAAAALELGLAGYYYYAAFDAARLWLPYPLQEQMTARFALDRFIFRAATPQAARRHYFMSHVFGCLGFITMAILAFANGPRIGGIAFAALSLLALGQTFVDWRKYRRLLQAKVSPPATAP